MSTLNLSRARAVSGAVLLNLLRIIQRPAQE
jgi:hypothetical protein